MGKPERWKRLYMAGGEAEGDLLAEEIKVNTVYWEVME